MSHAARFTVRHDAAKHRFETTVDGQTGLIDYLLDGPLMRIVHTVVHPAIEGRGVASALMEAALGHAREQRLKVEPLCSYARAYMQRHPETQDLLA
jgi:predicted GNAT family acetyltransferase